MAAAAKRGEKKMKGAKARGKCATNAREAKCKCASGGARNGSSAITIHAAEEEVVRRQRMELADALRARGVDEHGLAELYFHAFNKMRRIVLREADPKRSLDNLKELCRVLESKRASDRGGDRGGAQVLVQLVHQVARPERGMEAPAAAPGKDGAVDARERVPVALENFEPEICAIDVRAGEARD